ncbi:MAG: YwaF family protein [Oscillospiraceae bacterium]|nr:YwaF family protein [Oscillospiraceae bacterium]
MEYFWCTARTAPKGVGFSLFGATHVLWLVITIAVLVGCSMFYQRSASEGRSAFRKWVAFFLVIDELFKQVCLLATGSWLPEYLPLHLCSINIFVICWHAFRPSHLCGNFLYTVCIPGALAALLFPSWNELPFLNFMHLHSFTVHILLVLYPVMLTIAGDIRPDPKTVPKCLLILLVMAVAAYLINPLLESNFFFMASAGKGNPLYWFQQNWGNHLLGFPVLVSAVILVMHGPRLLLKNRRKKLPD